MVNDYEKFSLLYVMGSFCDGIVSVFVVLASRSGIPPHLLQKTWKYKRLFVHGAVWTFKLLMLLLNSKDD